jgi:hypothetical protein
MHNWCRNAASHPRRAACRQCIVFEGGCTAAGYRVSARTKYGIYRKQHYYLQAGMLDVKACTEYCQLIANNAIENNTFISS